MIAGIVLLVMAIQDYRTMIVSNWLQVLLFLSIVITNGLDPWLGLACIFILLSYKLYVRKFEAKIGGADIKIFASLVILGVSPFIRILFWSSLFGLIIMLITKKEKIPYVPFLWLGYIIVNF